MRWACSIALVSLIFTAAASALPGERRAASLVPWKIALPHESLTTPLTLFWVPSSPEEMRRSPLLTSDDLTLSSSRCVAMRVVRADDQARMEELGIHTTPAVVLADDAGRIVGSVESEDGAVAVREVEQLVRKELAARAGTAESRLAEARRRAAEGDQDAALALYRTVWAERCLCPRQGKVAQRALKRLERK